MSKKHTLAALAFAGAVLAGRSSRADFSTDFNTTYAPAMQNASGDLSGRGDQMSTAEKIVKGVLVGGMALVAGMTGYIVVEDTGVISKVKDVLEKRRNGYNKP